MIKKMRKCAKSGLFLPEGFNEGKASLKKSIESVVEKAINELGDFTDNYFLSIHACFDKKDTSIFRISAPTASTKLPDFMGNSMVFWVSPRRGICEILWMVAAKSKGEKLKVEFNKTGVAYLQAKDAMPKPS